jgi:hypothetical protein
VETGSINGQVNGVRTHGGTTLPVNAAIAASGNQLDPAVLATGTVSVSTFANGIDTRTRGADLTFNSRSTTPWATSTTPSRHPTTRQP